MKSTESFVLLTLLIILVSAFLLGKYIAIPLTLTIQSIVTQLTVLGETLKQTVSELREAQQTLARPAPRRTSRARTPSKKRGT